MKISSVVGSAVSTTFVVDGFFEAGAHLVSDRQGYTHHGIYAGNGKVIHYGGLHGLTMRRPVEYVSLREFAAGGAVRVQEEPCAIYGGADVVARAESRLGEDRYTLLTNNCEHFCTWCARGVARSEQVRRGLRNPWAGIKMLFALARGACESRRVKWSASSGIEGASSVAVFS